MNIAMNDYLAIMRSDFSSFVERSFTELNPHASFKHHPYVDLIASKLEECRKGTIRRFILNLPPRSLKSHTVSVGFVGWLLGHDPALHVLCASYGQDLSDKHARDCRTLMTGKYYRDLFPLTRLGDKQSVGEFTTTKGGSRLSTSVGGTITGRGADFIILDDVMKPEEALSETRRKFTNDWYQNTLLSRLNSKENGVIIIVMQRLHQDDLVGHVLEQDQSWEVLSLPAIAEEDESYLYVDMTGPTLFTRVKGAALHPERDPIEALLKVRREIGEYTFESQYQQNPLPIEGGVIKKSWLRYYPVDMTMEELTNVIQSWDTANKTGELNDYSVCTTWGYRDGHFFLIDVFRAKLDYPGLKRAVIEQSKKHTPRKILIEDKSSGIALVQELKREGVYGIEPCQPTPGSDKQMRLHAQATKFESGKVVLPEAAPWLDEYVRELTGFPGTRYDDQVDSTTQALEYLGRIGGNDIFKRLATKDLSNWPFNWR